TICSCCVSFIMFTETGEYRPTANGSSSNSTLEVIGVLLVVVFKDVLLFDIVSVGVVAPPTVVVLSASIGDDAAASSVDITELKPRSNDAAINRYDVMLVRLTLTLTGFTESTVIENYLILSP
ncbi:MAG: hypothetical protein MOP48_803, partial [Nitrososphaera sp.]|nr:hypothetical protein [Nitrososphaera sp.]